MRIAIALASLTLFVHAGALLGSDCPFSFFQPARRYPVEISQPTTIGSGDFDGDRIADVVVTGGKQVSILLSLPDGGFSSPQLLEMPGPVAGVGVGDFNADGSLDLAVLVARQPTGSDAIEILAGRGDGTFDASFEIALPGNSPRSVVVADLDGDSRPDLFVLDLGFNGFAPSAFVLFGSTDGFFSGPVTIALPAVTSYFSAVAGDFDGGGRDDVIVGEFVESLLVRSTSTRALSVDSVPDVGGHLAVADVDRDGAPDLLAVEDGTVSTFINDGHGSFELRPPQLSLFPDPVGTAVFDLNGDRNPDVVIEDFENCSLTVFFGNGDGSWRLHAKYMSGRSILSLVALPGGGRVPPRICALDRDGASVWIFGVDPMGEIGALPLLTESSFSVYAGDFDNDGHADIFTGCETLLGNGDGTFRSVQCEQTPIYVGNWVGRNEIADFDRDGNLDFLELDEMYCVVWFGTGDGRFVAGPRTELGSNFNDFAIDDVDGDGTPDLVDILSASEDDEVRVYRGKGDGTFEPARLTRFPSKFPFVSLRAGDFDGDGKIDLVAPSDEAAISVLYGNGDGTFSAAVTYQLSGAPRSMAAGRFDGSGRDEIAIDLAPIHLLKGGLTILLFQPDRTLKIGHVYPRAPVLLARDFDADGHVDLFAVAPYEDFAVLPGRGDGEFDAPIPVAANANYQTNFALADFNGDGRIDVASGGGAAVALFVQQPAIEIEPRPIPFGRVGGPYDLTLSAIGGTPPYAFRLLRGHFPPGISFDPGARSLSGTPQTAGDYVSELEVTDGVGCSATLSLDIHVVASPGRPTVERLEAPRAATIGPP